MPVVTGVGVGEPLGLAVAVPVALGVTVATEVPVAVDEASGVAIAVAASVGVMVPRTVQVGSGVTPKGAMGDSRGDIVLRGTGVTTARGTRVALADGVVISLSPRVIVSLPGSKQDVAASTKTVETAARSQYLQGHIIHAPAFPDICRENARFALKNEGDIKARGKEVQKLCQISVTDPWNTIPLLSPVPATLTRRWHRSHPASSRIHAAPSNGRARPTRGRCPPTISRSPRARGT